MSIRDLRTRKRLRNILVLLAGLTLGQYFATGCVHWPAVGYQLVTGALADYATHPLASRECRLAADFDLHGRVVRIADGDTVTILDRHNKQHKVRLHGIDTPERDQPYGTAATNALKRLINNKPVAVDIVTTDKYKRKVGTLYRDGVNINLAMVTEGYAWWYQYYAPNENALKAAEQRARRQKRGLWAGSHPIAPWDWRKKRR